MFAVTGFLYRQATTPLITEPKNSNHKFNREMIHIFPRSFLLLYLLLSRTDFTSTYYYIWSNASIAEVAALGRLGQLFFILSSFNSVIIGPY